MPAIKDQNEVTLHLKTQRQARDRLLGSLRSRGTTMQSFFDRLITTLNNDPIRLEEVLTWCDEPLGRRRGRPSNIIRGELIAPSRPPGNQVLQCLEG